MLSNDIEGDDLDDTLNDTFIKGEDKLENEGLDEIQNLEDLGDFLTEDNGGANETIEDIDELLKGLSDWKRDRETIGENELEYRVDLGEENDIDRSDCDEFVAKEFDLCVGDEQKVQRLTALIQSGRNRSDKGYVTASDSDTNQGVSEEELRFGQLLTEK